MLALKENLWGGSVGEKVLDLKNIEIMLNKKNFDLNRAIIFSQKNSFNFLEKKLIAPIIGIKIEGYIFLKKGKYYFSERILYISNEKIAYKVSINIKSTFNVDKISMNVGTEFEIKNINLIKSRWCLRFIYFLFFTKRNIWLLKISEQQKQQLIDKII